MVALGTDFRLEVKDKFSFPLNKLRVLNQNGLELTIISETLGRFNAIVKKIKKNRKQQNMCST